MKATFFRRMMIALTITLSACSSPSQPENIDAPTPFEVVAVSHEPSLTPNNTELTPASPTPTAVPTPAPLPPRKPHYTITAKLDFGWHNIAVAQSVTIPNPGSENIDELVLIVQPNWYPDAFQLIELNWGDGSPVIDYDLLGIELRIQLEDPISPGDERRLAMVYDLSLPPISTSENFGPIPFGYTIRQTNLVDWHPFVPPYQEGDGWVVHKPWFYGEHLVYPIADFDIAIEVINAPASLTIAASALDQGDEKVHRYQLKNGRNFVLSLGPSYQVFEGQVGDTTVLGYSFTYDRRAGQAAFDTTLEALTLCEELYYPYEQPVMTLVEADFNHGMEYQNLFFLSRGFYSTYDDTKSSHLVSIAAHETAHQWWYGLVGNDQALEPWLDEALCTYSELLFYENLYPDILENWWWPQRVEYYQPTGWVDLHLYNSGGYLPYRNAVYFQGVYFLDETRSLIGDDAFFSFLSDYAAMYAGKIATTDDFFSLLSEYAEVDLSGTRAKYFQSAP